MSKREQAEQPPPPTLSTHPFICPYTGTNVVAATTKPHHIYPVHVLRLRLRLRVKVKDYG